MAAEALKPNKAKGKEVEGGEQRYGGGGGW